MGYASRKRKKSIRPVITKLDKAHSAVKPSGEKNLLIYSITLKRTGFKSSDLNFLASIISFESTQELLFFLLFPNGFISFTPKHKINKKMV
jgi:hypothetical protein